MKFPKHTQLALLLYVHAVVAITMRTHFSSFTLQFHPLAILFLAFAGLDNNMVLVAHSLWFWWLQVANESDHNIWISCVWDTAALVIVVVAAQLVARSPRAAEYPVILLAAVLSTFLLATQAVLLTPTLLQLHVRTMVYYFMLWMLETASRRSTKMDLQARQLVSIVIVFSVLAVPLPVAVLLGIAGTLLTIVHIRDITDDSAR